MKWIGQHIWDFISRFRSTVYIENLETSSEENVLVVDSDGKVTKNTTLGGSDVTMANGITGRVMVATGAAAIEGEQFFTSGHTVDMMQLSLKSPEDTGDTFYIQTSTHGATTINTYDDDATAAHLSLNANGDLILNPATQMIKVGSLAGGTTVNFANNSGLLQVAGQTNITSVGTLTGLTTSGAIELGHADDTTLARSAAGIATIEGNQIFTTKIPALTSGAVGVPAVTMQTRRTITTAEANDMHNTTIELVPLQGSNNVIVPLGGMIRVDRAGAQNNTACDLNIHIGNHPGVYFSTSLAHIRRFMYGETGDRVFSITAMMGATEVGQSVSGDANKPLQISFDAAATTDCFTSIDVFLTYQVISIA
jgi:hypothetical protein